MTNQRKIFGAVLTLAMSAFGVDHLWIGAGPGSKPGPEAATGLPAPPPPAVRDGPTRRGGRKEIPAGPAAAARATPVRRSLAARLAEAARLAQLSADASDGTAVVPDAFEPSSLWYPVLVAPAPVAARAAPALPPEQVAEFRARHPLTAVMRSAGAAGAGGMAIIGGKLYVPGQAVDGFTLTSLGERSAVLSRGEVSIELRIDPPGALSSLSGGP